MIRIRHSDRRAFGLRAWIALAMLTLFIPLCGVQGALADQNFQITPAKITIPEGETAVLAVQRNGAAAEGDIVWTVGNARIAEVSVDGLVTAHAKGSTNVTATVKSGGRTYSSKCTVTVVRPASSIEVSEKNLTVLAPDDPRLPGLLPADAVQPEPGADAVAVLTEEPEAEELLPALILIAGKETAFSATVLPRDASDRSYAVSVADESLFKRVRRNAVLPEKPGVTVLTVASVSDPEVCRQYRAVIIRTVQKVQIDLSAKSIGVGGFAQASASVSSADATWQDVAWSTTTPKLISIDENGVITGLAKGTAKIRATATDGSKKYAETTIRVEQQPTGVTVKGKDTVAVGSSVNLQATVTPAGANVKTVTWQSSDPRIATVSAGGKVSGVAPGLCEIICTSTQDETVTYAFPITVVQKVTSITFGTNPFSLDVGTTARLSWTVSPENATDKTVTFTSSDKRIAAVDADGTVHGLKSGTVTVTAKAADGSGKTGRVKVTVRQPVTGVHMKEEFYTVELGERTTITAVIEPSNATDKNMNWYSEDPNIATVSGTSVKPKVQGRAWGTTRITGVTEDGGFTASCTVRVGTFNKALELRDFYLQGNQIRIRIRNQSNMNITRFYYTIEMWDEQDEPLPCSYSGGNSLTGYYLDALYAGEDTSHGRFHFDDFVEPDGNIGRMVITLTGYRCDDGYTHSYSAERRPTMEYISAEWQAWRDSQVQPAAYPEQTTTTTDVTANPDGSFG